jgi:hypothetical protein
MSTKKVAKRSPKYVVYYLQGGFPSGNRGISGIYITRATATAALKKYLKRKPDDAGQYEVRTVSR